MDEHLKCVHVDTQFTRRLGDNPEKYRHIIIYHGVWDWAITFRYIVTCHLCFSVELDVATFIFPSALDIDGGYAANSKANASSKLISRELASITILHIFKYQWRLTNTNELCVGPDVTSICRMLYICTFGYADGHRVQIYVSIANTEGVISIVML